MPLKQVQFKTNIFTGTGQKESTGQGLAKLLTHGVDVANKGMRIKQQLDDEQIKAQEEQDNIAYLTKINEYNKKFHERKQNGELNDSASMYAMNDEYMKESETLFPYRDSKYRFKYEAYILEKNSYGHQMLAKEQDKAYTDMMEMEIADLKLSDMDMSDIQELTTNGKGLRPNTNNGDTLEYALMHTANIMERELSDATAYVMSNEDVPTEEEIIDMYGGDTFKEIKNTSSPQYKNMLDKAHKMAEGLKVAYKSREADRFINTDGASFIAGSTKFGQEYFEKSLSKNIDSAIQRMDFNKAVDLSNMYKTNTGRTTILDSFVKEPSIEAYRTYHATKGTFDYDQKTIDDYVMLDAASAILNTKLESTDDIINAKKIIKISETRPLPKENTTEFNEELTSKSWFGIGARDYNKSQVNFIEERGKALMKLGMNPSDALDKAEEMFNQRDVLGNGIPIGVITGNSQTPKEDAEAIVKSFSSDNSIDNTTLRYVGNDTFIVDNETSGESDVFSSGDLKKRLFEEKKLSQTRDAILVLSGSSELGKDTKVDKEILQNVKNNIIMAVAKNFPDASEEQLVRQTQIAYREALNKIDEVKDKRRLDNRAVDFGEKRRASGRNPNIK